MFRVTPVNCAGCPAGSVGFCANLGPSAVEWLARTTRIVHFREAQIITGDGKTPLTALVMQRGTIKISHALIDGRQQIVDFLGAGDLLVLQPLGEVVERTVQAVTDVEACEIGLEAFGQLGAASPEFGQSMLLAALAQVDRKNGQLTMLGRKRADERVASFLLDLLDRARRRGMHTGQVELQMSRTEIADYLGLTTETVSRAFSVLREEGMIRLPKPHEVVICDLAMLREVAAGGANLSVR